MAPLSRILSFNFIHLFVFLLCWILITMHGLFSGCSRGVYSSCDAQASHCGGLSWCRAQALGRMGFSSCSMWAQQVWLLGPPRAKAQ